MNRKLLCRWLQFSLLGLPGCALVLGGTFVLLANLSSMQLEFIWLGFLAVSIGWPMLLMGTGRLREPLYALALVSLPCGALLWGTVGSEPAGSVLGGGLTALMINHYLERYYRLKHSGKGRPTTG